MNPWTILWKLFFCTIAFIPEMNDNSLDSFRKTDQNFNSFSETAQKLKLQNADYQRYFQNKKTKSCKCRWNFPAFGIEKNGPTYAEFEPCPKLDFSSFKTKKYPAFFKNGRDFWDKKKKSAHLIFFIKNLKKNPFFGTQFLSKKYVLQAVIRFLIIWLKLSAVSDQFQKKVLKLFETVKVSLKLVRKKTAFLA